MENTSKKTGVEVYKEHKNSFKAKRQSKWYEPMFDYYIDLAKSLNDKSMVTDAMSAAKGVISKSVMDEVLNQVNDREMNVTSSSEGLNILDDVDIITPIKERYMGDFVKTPNFYTCTLEGEDITLALKHKTQKKLFNVFTSKMKVELNDLIKEEQEKINQQQVQQGREGQAPQEEGVAPEPTAEDLVYANTDMVELAREIKKEFFNKEASKAKKLVEFFVKETRLDEQLYQLFYYFFATEEAYVKFAPTENSIGLELLHPEEYYRIPSRNSIFVEDDNAGVIIRKRNIKDILDEHGDKMTTTDIEYLSTLLAKGNNGAINVEADLIMSRQIVFAELYNKYKENLGTNDYAVFADDANAVLEQEIYFTTKRKIGLLSYMSATGELNSRRVGETYELNTKYGDVSIEWEWEDEVWRGYRWGNGNGVGVYSKPAPISVQRSDLGIKNTSKLPIIGIQGMLTDYGRKPIPLRMLSHQALYIILTNKYRKEMAKFHGFVNLLTESILSDSDEFTQEERLNYMFKDNLLIINDTEVDANTLQSLRTIGNTGQGDYIRVIDEMRKGIKAEAWDLANMNDQRYGNIDVRGGKGNNEEAIRRVSTGSILLFTMFDMLKERIYQAMSDYGRLCYTGGVNQDISDKDGNSHEIKYSHEELISSDLGIHFTTNAIEKEKIEYIRNAIVSSSVQTGNTLDAIDALKENDLDSLSKYAAQLQKAKEQREERLAKQEQEASKYIEDRKNELEDKKIKADAENIDTKGRYELLKKDKDIYKTMLELQHEKEMAANGDDGNGNGITDNYENDSLDDDMKFLETRIKEAQLELTNEKIKSEKKKQTEPSKPKG